MPPKVRDAHGASSELLEEAALLGLGSARVVGRWFQVAAPEQAGIYALCTEVPHVRLVSRRIRVLAAIVNGNNDANLAVSEAHNVTGAEHGGPVEVRVGLGAFTPFRLLDRVRLGRAVRQIGTRPVTR
jgi:hypothetical protein